VRLSKGETLERGEVRTGSILTGQTARTESRNEPMEGTRNPKQIRPDAGPLREDAFGSALRATHTAQIGKWHTAPTAGFGRDWD